MSALLYPMGALGVEPEAVRCRVYGDDVTAEDRERAAFVDRLCGPGVIDCPAYDPWVAALQERGWLDERPELERNPDGPGRIGRWRITAQGRAEFTRLMGRAAPPREG